MTLYYLFDYACNGKLETGNMFRSCGSAKGSTDIFICGLGKTHNMHDSESDTFHLVNKNAEFAESLKKIGVDAEAKEIDTDEVEKESYYSKYFSHSPSMVTNHGTISIKGSNIDIVQIIQKG